MQAHLFSRHILVLRPYATTPVRVRIPRRKAYEAALAPPAPDGAPEAADVPLVDGALFAFPIAAVVVLPFPALEGVRLCSSDRSSVSAMRSRRARACSRMIANTDRALSSCVASSSSATSMLYWALNIMLNIFQFRDR